MAIWESLIVCSGVGGEADAAGRALPQCGWSSLIRLVEVLIQDMVVLSTLLAGAVFAFIGFLLLTSGGNPSEKEKAKGMFMKVVKGYLWILFAWLVVYTITNTLLGPDYTLLKK